mgnify:CR=1 FL=1
MPGKRPTGRQKHVVSGKVDASRRGSGLGTGPVGSGVPQPGRPRGRGITRAAGGGGVLTVIIVIVLLLLNRGSSGTDSGYTYDENSYYDNGGGYSDSVQTTAAAAVDNTVASGSRNKYTNIRGDGTDTVTLMVYMCGTDLESSYGMATNDLREMANADLSDKVNIIVYTGGCRQWKTNGISSSTNQIYKIGSGSMANLVESDGEKSMTDPATLSSFIKYCSSNYPADRYELILWDHGGGSVSGYGYDEKFKSAGAMDLGEISRALNEGGVKFDFIGFDACLMATAETALMLDSYADYMIASEETEPGIGWYYTNWLTALSRNTSMPTVEIGKSIADDFISACNSQCRGQKTTLSVTDLAEFANTVPSKLSDFADSITGLIKDQDYKTVSDARYSTREFAQSSKIDQIDLADFAGKVNTSEGRELISAIQGAVKYNRYNNISDANGISIYFPYQRKSYVDTACETYKEIGLSDEYSRCIRYFASTQGAGQAAVGGSTSPFSSLIGGGSTSGFSSDLLSAFMGGDSSALSGGFGGLGSLAGAFLSDRAMPDEELTEYITVNSLDTSALNWRDKNGSKTISLTETQWELVEDVALNMFVDDGTGYMDLGLDNTLTYDEDDDLVCESDRTWLTVDGHLVAYYYTDTSIVNGNEVYSGYIPAFLNGERVNLIVVFDDEDAAHPYGYIAGATTDYNDESIGVAAKSLTEIKDGDAIDFICDYYSYDGSYLDTYYLGEQLTVSGEPSLANMEIADKKLLVTYRFTDIYNNQFWTESVSE